MIADIDDPKWSPTPSWFITDYFLLSLSIDSLISILLKIQTFGSTLILLVFLFNDQLSDFSDCRFSFAGQSPRIVSSKNDGDFLNADVYDFNDTPDFSELASDSALKGEQNVHWKWIWFINRFLTNCCKSDRSTKYTVVVL